MANDIVGTALQPGELTSEHAAMSEATSFGRIISGIGAVVAILPQIAAGLNWLPPSFQNNAYVQIGLIAIGGLGVILGTLKEALTKVAYIQGRSLIKAAAVRDVQP